MKKFADKSGWLRVVVCCLTLVVHHGLRDALIPALPTIAAPEAVGAPTTEASTPLASSSSAATDVTSSTADVTTDVPGSSFSTTFSSSPSPSDSSMSESVTDGLSPDVTASPAVSSSPAVPSKPSESPAVSSRSEVNSVRAEPSAKGGVGPSASPDPRPFESNAVLGGPSGSPLPPGEPSESPSATVSPPGSPAADPVLFPTAATPADRFRADADPAAPRTPDPTRRPNRIVRSLISSQAISPSRRPPTQTPPADRLVSDSTAAPDPPADAASPVLILESAVRKASPAGTAAAFSLLPSDGVFAAGDDLAGRIRSVFRQTLVRGVLADGKQLQDALSEELKRNSSSAPSRETPLSVLINRIDFSGVWLRLSGEQGRDRAGERNPAIKNVGLQERFLQDGNSWLHELQKWEWSFGDLPREASYYGPEMKAGWGLMVEGAVLSSVYWAWLLTAALADKVIDKAGVGGVLAASVGVTGILGLVTHPVSLGGPWALLALRVVQGAAQGLSFPAILRILEDIPESSRNVASLVTFLGPYLGTCLGVGLGSLEDWYTATYALGSVALVLLLPCLLLPPVEANVHQNLAWRRVLKSRAVWACLGVHVANTWVMHSLLVGVPFCLTYYLQQPCYRGWSAVAVVGAVAVICRPLEFLSPRLADKGPLSGLDRRRAPVLAGSLLVVTAVILMATIGLDSAGVLVGVAAGCAGVGVGLVRVGNRLNLEDLAPLQLWRLVHIFNLTGILTAAVVPVVLTAFAQAGKSGWMAVWLVPLTLVVPAALLHLFCLSSNAQSWDQPATGYDGPAARPVRVSTISVGGLEGVGVGVGVIANGHGPPKEIRRSLRSRQSFKSAKSALTYKTAMSRPRARSLSCRTVDDDLEADLKSVIEEASVECRSIAMESEVECRSVASTVFKSDCDDMFSAIEGTVGDVQRRDLPHALYNGTSLDRTTAWLSYHYCVDMPQRSMSVPGFPTKEETRRKNVVFALAW